MSGANNPNRLERFLDDTGHYAYRCPAHGVLTVHQYTTFVGMPSNPLTICWRCYMDFLKDHVTSFENIIQSPGSPPPPT